MEDRIEDKMFASALEASGIRCTQEMYEVSLYPHKCSMCGEEHSQYKLKTPFIESLAIETPYIFICKSCFDELGVV